MSERHSSSLRSTFKIAMAAGFQSDASAGAAWLQGRGGRCPARGLQRRQKYEHVGNRPLDELPRRSWTRGKGGVGTCSPNVDENPGSAGDRCLKASGFSVPSESMLSPWVHACPGASSDVGETLCALMSADGERRVLSTAKMWCAAW